MALMWWIPSGRQEVQWTFIEARWQSNIPISLAQGFESIDEEVVNDEGNSDDDDDATVGKTHGSKGGWGIETPIRTGRW